MSIRVLDLVLRNAPYGSCTLLVFIALANWSNDDGERVFPKMQQVADYARISMRGAQIAMRELEDGGYLIPVAKSTGGRGKFSEYKINVEKLKTPQRVRGKINPADGGIKTPQMEARNPADGGKSPTPPYIDNRQVEPSSKSSRRDDDLNGAPDPRIVEQTLSRICEILGVTPPSEPERDRWTLVVSRMLEDGLDLHKHIIPAAELARDNGISSLAYIRKVGFNLTIGKTNEPGFSAARHEASLSAHSAFTLGAARAAGLLDEWGSPIVAAGCSEDAGDEEFGDGGVQTIEGRITARG